MPQQGRGRGAITILDGRESTKQACHARRLAELLNAVIVPSISVPRGSHLKQISLPSSFFEDTAVRRLHIIKRTTSSLFQRFAQRRFLNELIQQRTVVSRITIGV